MSHTGIETDVPAVRQGGATNAAIVTAVEIGGAALLGASSPPSATSAAFPWRSAR